MQDSKLQTKSNSGWLSTDAELRHMGYTLSPYNRPSRQFPGARSSTENNPSNSANPCVSEAFGNIEPDPCHSTPSAASIFAQLLNDEPLTARTDQSLSSMSQLRSTQGMNGENATPPIKYPVCWRDLFESPLDWPLELQHNQVPLESM